MSELSTALELIKELGYKYENSWVLNDAFDMTVIGKRTGKDGKKVDPTTLLQSQKFFEKALDI
jgi:hypothetical protein